MASPIIDFLLTRNSAPIPDLREPAPSDSEIAIMLTIATRVPDHGRLRRGASFSIAATPASGSVKDWPNWPNARGAAYRRPSHSGAHPVFARAAGVGVVSSPKDNPKIPEWEMFLSGGMAAMNL